MSEPQKPARKGDLARAARLQKAMRENLLRRKAQMRGRAGRGDSSGPVSPPAAAAERECKED
jgi:hypothetical protein